MRTSPAPNPSPPPSARRGRLSLASVRANLGRLRASTAILTVAFMLPLLGPALPSAGQTSRLSGPTRVETAVEVAREAFGARASTVTITPSDLGDSAYGALVVAPIGDGPKLLSTTDSIHPAVLDALEDWQTTTVRLVGPAGTWSSSITDDLQARGLTVTTIGGATWPDVAATIIEQFAAPGQPLGLFSANTVVDGVPASVMGIPLYPVDAAMTDQLRTVIREMNPSYIVAFGGTAVISDTLFAQAAAGRAEHSVRLGGATRVETAAAIATANYRNGADVVYIADAYSYIDALTAGNLSGGPVLLLPSGPLPQIVTDTLADLAPRQVVAIGGTARITNSQLQEAQEAADSGTPNPEVAEVPPPSEQPTPTWTVDATVTVDRDLVQPGETVNVDVDGPPGCTDGLLTIYTNMTFDQIAMPTDANGAASTTLDVPDDAPAGQRLLIWGSETCDASGDTDFHVADVTPTATPTPEPTTAPTAEPTPTETQAPTYNGTIRLSATTVGHGDRLEVNLSGGRPSGRCDYTLEYQLSSGEPQRYAKTLTNGSGSEVWIPDARQEPAGDVVVRALGDCFTNTPTAQFRHRYGTLTASPDSIGEGGRVTIRVRDSVPGITGTLTYTVGDKTYRYEKTLNGSGNGDFVWVNDRPAGEPAGTYTVTFTAAGGNVRLTDTFRVTYSGGGGGGGDGCDRPRMPWAAGETWQQTSGIHQGALDFDIVANNDSPRVLAVCGGQARRVCSDRTGQASVELRTSRGTFKYVHLDAGSVSSAGIGTSWANVPQGKVLGRLDPSPPTSNPDGDLCGHSNGRAHLHLRFPSLPFTLDGHSLSNSTRGQTFGSTNTPR